MAYSSEASYAAGTEQGSGERTIPADQTFVIQRRRKTVQAATTTPRAKKGHSRKTPRNTN